MSENLQKHYFIQITRFTETALDYWDVVKNQLKISDILTFWLTG